MAKFYARLLMSTALMLAAALVLAGLMFFMSAGQTEADVSRQTTRVRTLREMPGKGEEDTQGRSRTVRNYVQGPDVAAVGHPDTLEEISGEKHESGYREVSLGGEGRHGAAEYVLVTDDNTTSIVNGWEETALTLKMCGKVDYSQMALPDLSVIICFHGGENVSNLLHTIHSVHQRTPAHLLREIILIDDNSQNEDFGQTLEIYGERVFEQKIRIIRSKQKLGLIRARLIGIRAARGEVVVSMDSHIEVQHRWAEPMLKEISENPKTLCASYLDWMAKKGEMWEYKYGGSTWKSYFDWTFIFGWQMMSPKALSARKSLTEANESPVIIGTIFAIKKSFFEEVGAFDPGMQLWGGENLDLPVRVWLFGGRVVNVPCSRAGHLEAHGHRDYRLSQEFVEAKYTNYKRFAEVWAGEYRKYFYMYTPAAKAVDEGDLSDRLRLKSVCKKDFGWFLDNIFPELGMPDRNTLAWGPLRNIGTNTCLDTKVSLLPGIESCGTGFSRQGVFWSKELYLRFPIHVIKAQQLSVFGIERKGLYLDEYIHNYNSTSITTWFHWEFGPIMDIASQECLAADINGAVFKPCDFQSRDQRWHFEHYSEDYYDMISGNIKHADSPEKRTLIKSLLTTFQEQIKSSSVLRMKIKIAATQPTDNQRRATKRNNR